MRKFKLEIVLGGLLLILIIGFIYWFSVHESDASLKIVLAAILTIGGLVIYVYNAWKKKKDIEKNIIIDDEMTIKIKVYAGNKSFQLSFYLWILIFIFNGLFHEAEAMLGTGILGPALIYVVCLKYYKSTQNFKAPNL